MSAVLYDVPGPRARRRNLIGSVVGAAVLLAGTGWLLWRLADRGIFEARRWDIFSDPEVWEFLVVDGLGATLRAAAIAAVLAFALGLLLAVGRMAPVAWVRVPVTVVVELFRGLPVVLLMFFGVIALGATIFQGVVFGLVVYNAAIIGEILRAGIVSLPKGQSEAAYAIGLNHRQTLLTILLPQAVRRMLPSLISQLVVLLKDTSLGYIVGYAELLRSVQNLRDFFGNTYLFPLFFVGAAIYIAVNFTLSRVAVWIEKRGSRQSAGPTGQGAPVQPEGGQDPEVARVIDPRDR